MLGALVYFPIDLGARGKTLEARTKCKTDQGALASLRWWGIDEDATRTRGHSRFGKGFQDLFMSIVDSTSQFAMYPAVTRCRLRVEAGWPALV
jgi:hypothetical protein